MEPAEGKFTDPVGGTKQKGLVELKAKVHGLATWMNAGRRLLGRTEQPAGGKIGFRTSWMYGAPQILRWRCIWESMMDIWGPCSSTTWSQGQRHVQKPRPRRKRDLPKFTQLARETASLKLRA